ncbi:MAG: hypothetical protein ABSF29_07290 [Tepidisphaeraceae bacterium]|jgi:hypothetical protein
MKLLYFNRSVLILAGALALAGCTVVSPISMKNVDAKALNAEWSQFQASKTADQQAWQNKITEADNDQTNAIDVANSSPFGQIVAALNNPQYTSAGATLLTSILGVLGAGLHVNNLRLDRKIANPEVPMAGGANPPTGAAAPPNPVAGAASPADVGLQGAIGAAAANSKTTQ